MNNPIASAPTNKRSVLLGGVAAATILAMIFLLLSPNSPEDNQENDQQTGAQRAIVTAFENDALPPATPAQNPSENMSRIAGTGSQSFATGRINIESPPPASADTPDDDAIYIEPPAMLSSEDSVPAPASASSATPGSGSSVTELELARELKTRLEQTEKRLQTLQIQLNEQIQYAQKKANESQRWQDAAVQMEATMKKIIDDNQREAEQMAREIEHWREQALAAERQNASLAERRSATPARTTLQLPPATAATPAPAAPRPLPPLQLQRPAQSQPRTPEAQPLPQPQPPAQTQTQTQGNFTTTCYDPNRGYFPCTVRQ